MEEFLGSTSTVSLDVLITKLVDLSVSLGSKLITALIVFLVGRWIIRKLNRLLIKIMENVRLKLPCSPSPAAWLKSR